MEEQLIRDKSPTVTFSSSARLLRVAALLSTGPACACLALGLHTVTLVRYLSLSGIILALFMSLAGAAAALLAVALRATAFASDARRVARTSCAHAVSGLGVAAAFAWSAETYLAAYSRERAASEAGRMFLITGAVHATMSASTLVTHLAAVLAAARHEAECKHTRTAVLLCAERRLGFAGRNADRFFQACFGCAVTAIFSGLCAFAMLGRSDLSSLPLVFSPAADMLGGLFFLILAVFGAQTLVQGRPARLRIILLLGVAFLAAATVGSIVLDVHAMHTGLSVPGPDGQNRARGSAANISFTSFAALVGTIALVRTASCVTKKTTCSDGL